MQSAEIHVDVGFLLEVLEALIKRLIACRDRLGRVDSGGGSEGGCMAFFESSSW